MVVGNKQKTKAFGFKKSNRLSVKLVIETLVFSLCISVLVSGMQIYSTYKTSMAAAEHRYTEIEAGFLPSLSAGLWEVNTQRVAAQLDSIAQLPNVGRVYLIDEQQNQLLRNNDSTEAFSKREMKLIYTENGSSFDLGVLGVELNNHELWLQLKTQAVQTATITSLTLFTSALFILFLFQLRVSRHLQTMALFAKDFDVHKLGKTLTLHRKANTQADELDIVVCAINEMQNELKHELELRAKVEQELRTHQENLEELVKERSLELKLNTDILAIAADVAGLAVWQWNVSDDSIHWNKQMFELFAQPTSLLEEGLNYHHWLNRVHPDDAEETAASLRAEIQGNGKLTPVYRLLVPSGEVRYVQAAMKVERDKTGAVIRAIGVNLDITQRMEIENNLRTAKEQADAANTAKSAFLANMSHEIRTPMNAVLGMLQLLHRTTLSERQTDYVVKSQNAAKSLLNLLSDILDLSKADAGKLQLENNPFDLESLLQDLAVAVCTSQENNAVELMFDIDPNIPRSLVGDKFRLQQVLINLAGNALKFTLQGQVRIVIEQVLRNEQDVQLKFSVIDTGIGISAEHIEHIFDEFTQAETSTTRRFGGTGLGLVISKTLVQRMGGELQVNSEVEQGSHFWFEVTLKLSDAALACEDELNAALANSRILVLDDNAVSREILVRTLGQFSNVVEQADLNQSVLETIRQAEHTKQAYDVVLIDWRVANLHSQNTAELIIDDADIKLKPAVVLLTAYGCNDILDSDNDAASVYADILFKPITPLQLKQSLGHCIQKKQRKVEPSQVVKTGSLKGLKFLVVDDNEINRLIAFELLKHEGAEVELADGGILGVKTLLNAEQQFDAVLMDIQMPDIDGYEATRQIRADERFSTLPIIALTANVSQQDIDDCLAAGMNGHIGKPFDITQVVNNILNALEQTS
ncbi:response regulator [Paraglaciecola hydrolytica]|uniref:Sensory/regulatory protein RpfC n=1 Tax=Paraglaciecola hydrolytica TaxID=1799789 RepID=A0A136A552_9ALTE|nr:response regulator [Paraglaciecola hydrolytica]KXI30372.1 hypothetical protein AX660_10390 [Paraglaciecola hydrolytica]